MGSVAAKLFKFIPGITKSIFSGGAKNALSSAAVNTAGNVGANAVGGGMAKKVGLGALKFGKDMAFGRQSLAMTSLFAVPDAIGKFTAKNPYLAGANSLGSIAKASQPRSLSQISNYSI